MNLNKSNSSIPPPPPRFTVCHRHPSETVTGFCAACLSERLTGLDPAGIKSVLETGQTSTTRVNELSRSKSCSGHRNGCKRSGFVICSTGVELRRKSCDVRGRSSLSSLFDIDDGEVKGGAFMNGSVGGLRCGRDEDLGIGEIRVSEQIPICEDLEWRTMKEHMDLECRWKKVSKGKDLKKIAGSFWIAAASSFSKKLQKWRQKQKIRMQRNGDENGGMNVRQWREIRSEVGEYGFGRRSCDTEPRFSVDAGRASVDCPRFSLDEGRYLIRRSSANRLSQMNQMLSVVENDDRYVEDVNVISVKSGNVIDESPGGTEQTRDYYGEELSKRRRSFDRYGSNKKASSVELEESRAVSNSRISPSPATVELFHGAKVLLTKNDVKIPILSPIKTKRMETSDSASIVEEHNGNLLEVKKLAVWRKAWTNWGLSRKQFDEEEFKAAEKVTSSGTHVTSSTSSSISGSFIRSSTDTNGFMISRTEQQLRLERNKSTRYSPSPSNLDNGLLRFYITPSRGLTSGKCSKSRLHSSQDVPRNAFRL